MYEMMVDLETLDTIPSAVVLSIGAVVWESYVDTDGTLVWNPVERFLRVLDMEQQFRLGRTVSQDTLLWWQRQDPTARAEALNPVRQPVSTALGDLMYLSARYDSPGITAFWASPATFDFPIWEDLARTFSNRVPWTYRQKYDVRTVVREASFSASGHRYDGPGVPHAPVYDCEWQIDVLTAARGKLKRRIENNS